MVMIRTLSKNGQIAIPKRFLRALGLMPPTKVQIAQERGAIIIQRSPMAKMSDEAFLKLLDRVRRRNAKVTHRQVAEVIRQVRRGE